MRRWGKVRGACVDKSMERKRKKQVRQSLHLTPRTCQLRKAVGEEVRERKEAGWGTASEKQKRWLFQESGRSCPWAKLWSSEPTRGVCWGLTLQFNEAQSPRGEVSMSKYPQTLPWVLWAVKLGALFCSAPWALEQFEEGKYELRRKFQYMSV